MSLNQLADLQTAANSASAAWLRQMLTLAAAALAILAGMSPPVTAGLDRYFLAATWVLLGVGLLSGTCATYLEVDRAEKLATEFRRLLQKSIAEAGTTRMTTPVVANPHWIFRIAKRVMVISLLLSVVCLVTYAVLVTLKS